ncbi:class I SAM-dependent methyltransferase [Sphingomonas rubra]|uniref:Methyltransferase domain-containing protein n=1 Tax=Sphingomonas rubra TaxID=634430 RepID=A0A1I5RHL2_9SPHN|nr:methyltransferase domain-containing protein [Sphingomonas rubra]SFP57426.1 Methyltransferase domain-containing protein [Sphingomonas rubra]
MSDARALGLPEHAFDKQDDGADLDFYAPPRLVTHIDEDAVAALTRHYAALLKDGDRVLDLMSSWVSHLPDDLDADVVGHGMNAQELASNPRLRRWFVQDLNRDPTLPEPDAGFDAVLICVGVQYLQQPLAVFREVHRVLRPGGLVIASYANRCFPTKAVAIWRALDMEGQAALIRRYLDAAGFHDVAATLLADGCAGDPLVAVTARVPCGRSR